MDAWNELLKQSLLGVERQPLRMPPAPGALGDVLSRLDAGDKEAALLRAAGVVAVYRLAGEKARPAADAPQAPGKDKKPVCSLRATKQLSAMLEDLHADVLPEWLAAATQAGKRVPEEWLPAALNLGQRRRELRAGIVSIVGERGRWLGTQNPEWSFVCGGGEPSGLQVKELWELGSVDAREELLRGVLRASPASATDLLRSTWKSDSAPDRARFLRVCFDEASGALDEAFAEQCLDDKRKEVREVALSILQSRPGSQLTLRQTQRAKACLKLLNKSGKQSLEITLPEACDKAMERDGVNPKEMPFKMSERAAILCQILCAVPPQIWSELAPVEHWIAAASDSDYDTLLFHAWREACVRFNAGEWAEALLELPLKKKQSIHEHFRPFAALSPERKEAYLLRQMKECDGRLVSRDEKDLVGLLLQCSHNWGPAFARAIVQALKGHVAGGVDWRLRSQLRQLARYIPVSLNAEVQKEWPVDSAQWDSWREQVDGFLSVLQFRFDLYEALKEA